MCSTFGAKNIHFSCTDQAVCFGLREKQCSGIRLSTRQLHIGNKEEEEEEKRQLAQNGVVETRTVYNAIFASNYN
jgi:hypothetical protein